MMSVEREFESLFRSQVRELEAASLTRTPVREAMETDAAVPVRKLPKFRRTLVESRRAMRSREASSISISTALITAIPMTVLTASTFGS
jgi:hypothetical protein